MFEVSLPAPAILIFFNPHLGVYLQGCPTLSSDLTTLSIDRSRRAG